MTHHLFRKALLAGVIALVITAASVATLPAAQTAPQIPMPQYDPAGALRLPSTYKQWILVGQSLGLSYSEGARGAEMFHETLMEPTAYEHYVRTGEFREGTMLALLLHSTQDGVLPGRQGRFAGPLMAVEMAVKDKKQHSEGWAYYNFGGPDGLRTTAQAMPQASCFNCHKQNAKYDNVFLQFYSLLAAARPASSAAAAPSATPTPAPVASQARVAAQVALRGLDPVLLVEGREERGKEEIIATHDGFEYQFVSEPNRQRFVANPAQFAIQNKMCLVVRDAPIDPSLYAVHEKRVYAFATPDCIQAFKANPQSYLPKGKE